MGESRHLRASLGLCAIFLATGLLLEALVGLRVVAWLEDESRRSLVTLGHAHGGLLGLLNLALAFALQRLRCPEPRARVVRLGALIGAALVGFGFVLGGLTHGPTDPGMPILLVPAGALMLLGALIVTACSGAFVHESSPR